MKTNNRPKKVKLVRDKLLSADYMVKSINGAVRVSIASGHQIFKVGDFMTEAQADNLASDWRNYDVTVTTVTKD